MDDPIKKALEIVSKGFKKIDQDEKSLLLDLIDLKEVTAPYAFDDSPDEPLVSIPASLMYFILDQAIENLENE